MSLTWQVYHTSQWGETWTWMLETKRVRKPRHRQDRTHDNMGETGCFFVGVCVHEKKQQTGVVRVRCVMLDAGIGGTQSVCV